MVVAKRGAWRFWILVVLRRLGITGLLGAMEEACSDRAGLSVRRCSSLPLVRGAKRAGLRDWRDCVYPRSSPFRTRVLPYSGTSPASLE
jgi:hypothetical protein